MDTNEHTIWSVAGQAKLAKSNSLFEPIDVDSSDSKLEEPSWRLDKSGACNVSSDSKSDTKTAQNYNSDVPFPVEHIGVKSAEKITRLDANVMSGLDTDVSRAKRSEDTIRGYKNSNIDLNMMTVETVPIRVDSDDDHSVENKLSVSGSNFARCEVSGQAELEKSHSVFEPIDVDASDSKFEEPTRRLDESGACNVSSDAKSDTKTVQNHNSDVQYSVEHIADESAERITRLDANVMSGLETDVSSAKRSEDTIRDYKNSNIDLNLLPVDTMPISVDSDDDCSVENERSVSDSKFALFEGLLGDDLSGVDVKLKDAEMTVLIAPDIIFYGDIYSMKASLIFSSQGIRLEASTHFGTKRSIEVEWAVSEIFSIRSLRCASLAEITLLFKSNDTKIAGVENAGNTKINFSVSDPNWAQKEKAIRSLNRRYKICWNAAFDTRTSLDCPTGEMTLPSGQRIHDGFIWNPNTDSFDALRSYVTKAEWDAVADLDPTQRMKLLSNYHLKAYILGQVTAFKELEARSSAVEHEDKYKESVRVQTALEAKLAAAEEGRRTAHANMESIGRERDEALLKAQRLEAKLKEMEATCAQKDKENEELLLAKREEEKAAHSAVAKVKELKESLSSLSEEAVQQFCGSETFRKIRAIAEVQGAVDFANYVLPSFPAVYPYVGDFLSCYESSDLEHVRNMPSTPVDVEQVDKDGSTPAEEERVEPDLGGDKSPPHADESHAVL